MSEGWRNIQNHKRVDKFIEKNGQTFNLFLFLIQHIYEYDADTQISFDVFKYDAISNVYSLDFI